MVSGKQQEQENVKVTVPLLCVKTKSWIGGHLGLVAIREAPPCIV